MERLWEGVLNYYKKTKAYLQGQLGNPKGESAEQNTMTRAYGCVLAELRSLVWKKHLRTERD